MRRKDREMGRDFGIEVIDRSKYGIISMVDEDNLPYGIPLSIVRDDDNLYFHSAMDGKKVNIFDKNPLVNIAFVGETKIPEVYTKEQLDEIVKDESKAVLLISKVFTTEYESVVVKGRVVIVEAEEEKIHAMRLICEKYTPTKMDYFSTAIKAGLKRTNVYMVKIEDLRAKRKKYDKDGQEMRESN